MCSFVIYALNQIKERQMSETNSNTWEVREVHTKFQPGMLKRIGHFRNLGVNIKIDFKERV
jgi:hypothetical protein